MEDTAMPPPQPPTRPLPLLAQFRRQRGLTQRQLADFLGISQAAISLAERGRGKLGKENWFRLADLFEVDPRILTGRGIHTADV